MPFIDNVQRSRVRTLRQSQTDAETLLWRKLRYDFCGIKFRRQHPTGPYIIDFYCPSSRLAIELDGHQHHLPTQAQYDARRTSFLNEQNIRVVRVRNSDVLLKTRSVLEYIWDEIHQLPHPILPRQNLPSPKRRGLRLAYSTQEPPIRSAKAISRTSVNHLTQPANDLLSNLKPESSKMETADV